MQIKAYQRENFDKLRVFIDQNVERDHLFARDERYLSWQFDSARSPRSIFKNPALLLAWEGPRIVGMIGLISCALNIQGKVFPAVWISTWFCLPEAKINGAGLNLFLKVHQLGYEAVCVLGMSELAKGIYKAFHYEMMEDVPRWIKVMDFEKTVGLLEEVLPQYSSGAIKIFCKNYFNQDKGAVKDKADIVVAPFAGPFTRDWDESWRENFAPGLISTNRDAAYLNWRYVQHPYFSYIAIVARAKENRRILGLAVYRIEIIHGREDKILRIMEFLSLPECAQQLTSAIIRDAEKHGVLFIDFYCSNHKVGKSLESGGFKYFLCQERALFFPTRFQPLENAYFKTTAAIWTSKFLKNKYGHLFTEEALYITKSDSDRDRPN